MRVSKKMWISGGGGIYKSDFLRCWGFRFSRYVLVWDRISKRDPVGLIGIKATRYSV